MRAGMQAAIAAMDVRIETPASTHRFGIVTSVTGDYSSDFPLVELDDAAGTNAPLTNYWGGTLAVGAKVVILVAKDGDHLIIGKHPGTP